MNKIAIIGGGISGVTCAIKLAENKNNKIDLYEMRDYLLKGPPYCHLHAGGILYPEISLTDAQELLNDSIEFAKYFKDDCLETRPTIVAYRSNSNYCPSKLVFKCKVNKLRYCFSNARPFGKVENFYAMYTREDIIYYKKIGKFKEGVGREYHNIYVEQFCKLLDDINSIKYPIVSVSEPGIKQEMVEGKLLNQLKQKKNIRVILNKNINLSELNNYNYKKIINASGTNLFNNKKEMYEFKSSWLINSNLNNVILPEIAIIGERDTNLGMIQFTPLNKKGIFQIHCMRDDSTIIKNNINLTKEEIEKRTNVAIKEISKIFSIFRTSKIEGACPGIQRMPYHNRISKIECINKYIDIKLLKATSIISIVNKLNKLI